VTENVLTILQHLRHETQGRCLWIDALCIDQNNDAEKSLQVPLMRLIYAKAQAVIIWLGYEGHEDEALAVIAAARWLRSGFEEDADFISQPLVTCFTRRNPTLRWSGPFHRITALTWFQRIWVVQEAVFATNPWSTLAEM